MLSPSNQEKRHPVAVFKLSSIQIICPDERTEQESGFKCQT
jgi:hypothetical protein